MSFIWPPNPTPGQRVTGPYGEVYQWDAIAWSLVPGGAAGGGGGDFPEAPSDGRLYGRNGQLTQWQPVVPAAGGAFTGAVSINAGAPGSQPAQLGLGGQGISYLPYAALGQNIAFLVNGAALYVYQNGTNVGGAIASQTWVGQNYLALGGGTMLGPLLLAGDGVAALNPVSVQQLDAAVAGGPFLPLSGGTVTGVTTFTSNVIVSGGTGAVPAVGGGGLHLGWNFSGGGGEIDLFNLGIGGDPGFDFRRVVTSGSTSFRMAYLSANGTFIPAGPVVLPADPTTAMQATNKAYVDNTIATAPWINDTGRNRLHNIGFSINQRGYASGAALAANAYGHDRWKGGAAGCTYTFVQTQPFTTITITAGTLQQAIEADNIEGGTYTLSWTGTAQGRINLGAYAASPVTVAGLPANTLTTVEFSAGTLGQVQLEIGDTATPLAKRDPVIEYALCQRFYQVGALYGATQLATTGAMFAVSAAYMVALRANPTVAVVTNNNQNMTNTVLSTLGGTAIEATGNVSNANINSVILLTWTASADL